jgi:hypothetical protein
MYKTIILLLVLYRCETWSVTLREEHKLRVFKNRVLRRMFGPKRDEMMGWRRLHNEELHNLLLLPNIIRMIQWRNMRWAGHLARTEVNRSVYGVFVRKPAGKSQLRQHRWEDNVKMDLREMGCWMWTGFIWLRIETSGRLL